MSVVGASILLLLLLENDYVEQLSIFCRQVVPEVNNKNCNPLWVVIQNTTVNDLDFCGMDH
jgi:hypothetical protein